MSPIGRIFVVLNLVLAAAFLGWASSALSTSQNYKLQLEEAQAANAKAMEEKDAELSGLEIQFTQASEDARRRREERDQLESAKEKLETELAERKRENDRLGGDISKIQATLGDYDQTISRLSSAKDDAVERAHEMENERDEAVAVAEEAEMARRDAEEALAQTEANVAGLMVSNNDLKDQVAMLDTRLTMLIEVTGTSVPDILAQPEIDAAILDVRTDLEPGLVMLNVGKSSGVKRGFTFDVYSGGSYKGRVRVENVQEALSSALIVMPVEGQIIRQGDLATTRL